MSAVHYSAAPAPGAPGPGYYRVTIELPEQRLWLCGLEVYAASEDELEYAVHRIVADQLRELRRPPRYKLN